MYQGLSLRPTFRDIQVNTPIWTIICPLGFFTIYRYITSVQHDQLLVALIAQLVECCTGIVEVNGFESVSALMLILRLWFSQLFQLCITVTTNHVVMSFSAFVCLVFYRSTRRATIRTKTTQDPQFIIYNPFSFTCWCLTCVHLAGILDM